MNEPGLLCHFGPCTVLGGTGYNLAAGGDASVSFYTDAIVIADSSRGTPKRITYPEVVTIQIDGPGSVTRGGGFIGGGFGFEGAVEGIALATVLNALTTKTKIHTFIQITTDTGELFLHYGQLEPGALRIALSPVFTYLRKLDPAYAASRIQRLEALRERRLIDEQAFSRLSAQVTAFDGLAKAAAPASARNTASKILRCPRCKAEVIAGAHCPCGWF